MVTVPYMQKHKSGNIVYVSSIYGIIGAPDVLAYHATKAANRVMAKIDALLYAKDNIRVNSVHPGFIWTPMVENFLKEQSKKTGLSIEELRTSLDQLHPIGHIGEPEDIANGVLYLVSDEAKFVTGTELIIDGGYTTTSASQAGLFSTNPFRSLHAGGWRWRGIEKIPLSNNGTTTIQCHSRSAAFKQRGRLGHGDSTVALFV